MPTDKVLLQHQRDILRRMRRAIQGRTTTETNAKSRFQSQQQILDTTLNTSIQRIQHTRDQTTVQAKAAYNELNSNAKAEHDETLRKVTGFKKEQITAYDDTKKTLSIVGLSELIGTRFTGVSPQDHSPALPALESALGIVLNANKTIQSTAQLLANQRQVSATRRLHVRRGTMAAIIILAFAGFIWYTSWQRNRETLFAQATAVAIQAIEATATAVAEPTVTAQAFVRVELLMANAEATAVAAGHTLSDVWVNPVDEAVYVYVPRDRTIDAYWIMRTEVSNEQYARCVAAGGCSAPDNNRWQDSAYSDHPVTNILQEQAREYAQWVGGILPTSKQWEHACRGTDGREYPWGNTAPTDILANFNNNVEDTQPVGIYPEGASPFGALDMSGNVWEWIDEPGALSGGGFNREADSVRCEDRYVYGDPSTSDSQHRNVGFRVAVPTE